MSIIEYEKRYAAFSMEQLQTALEQITQQIEFLQSIYETGGKNNFFSKEFQFAALREREELCKKSSALHALIRL